MNKLKITWSKKIPITTGYYLTRTRVGTISNTHITLQDLAIQKEDETWLGGVWYSQDYVEEFDE
jgi:hypothetical protein